MIAESSNSLFFERPAATTETEKREEKRTGNITRRIHAACNGRRHSPLRKIRATQHPSFLACALLPAGLNCV